MITLVFDKTTNIFTADARRQSADKKAQSSFNFSLFAEKPQMPAWVESPFDNNDLRFGLQKVKNNSLFLRRV